MKWMRFLLSNIVYSQETLKTSSQAIDEIRLLIRETKESGLLGIINSNDPYINL
tara:strand:- start:238 stop:399 length:162 start_codon:yes stop_codon:yes gene_type:complete